MSEEKQITLQYNFTQRPNSMPVEFLWTVCPCPICGAPREKVYLPRGGTPYVKEVGERTETRKSLETKIYQKFKLVHMHHFLTDQPFRIKIK